MLANVYTRASAVERGHVCASLAALGFDIEIMTRVKMRSTPKGYSRWMLSQRAICSFPLWLETLLKAAVPHKARIGPSLVPPLSCEGWGFLQ